MINSKDDLIKLFYETAKELGVSVDIPISFRENVDYLGSIQVSVDDDLNITLKSFYFNINLIGKKIKFVKKIIIHELIHYKIFSKNKSQIYNIINIVFPHGLGFIFYAIKYKTWWFKYVVTLGLSQNQLTFLKDIKITITND